MMRKYTGLIIFLLSLTVQFGAIAQQTETVSGRVTSPYRNEPVEGAIISVRGQEATAETDSSGYFTINVTSLNNELSVWAPGYYNIIQPILGRREVPVVLVAEGKYNYNPMQDNLTLSASNSQTLQEQNFKTGALYVEDVLRNAFPGLNVINKSGMPGEGAYINFRGIRTLTADNTPLIVVNGVPYLPDMNNSAIVGGFSRSPYNTINVNDVESITLLKGAQASRWGSMGSNGVLLIETSMTTEFETVLEFSGQYGVSQNKARLPVMNVEDFKSYIGDVGLTQFEDMGVMLETFPFLKDDPEYYYNFLYNNNTDWQSLIYRPGIIADNNLRIKGGDNIAKYDLAVGVLSDEGTLQNTNLTRYNTRLNASITLSQKFELFTSVGFSYVNSNQHEQGMIAESNPILASLYKSPILNPYSKDEYNNQLPTYDRVRQFGVSNPLAVANTVQMETDYYDLFLNTGLNYQWTQNLKLTGNFGLFSNYTRQTGFIPGKSENSSILALNQGVAQNTARSGIGQSVNTYYNLKAQYNKDFGNNQLNAGLGYHGLLTRQEFDAGNGRNTSSDFYTTLSHVSNDGRNFWGYINMWNWMSGYGYADYTFNKLLTASLNVSVDGSSSTGTAAPRAGIFPGGSLTWMVKNTGWLKNVNAINKFNLRAGYAVTGNSRFSSNLSKQYYTSQIYRELSGIVRGNIANPDLKWETSNTMDAGVELSLFNYRLMLSADVYNTLTTDVIMPREISPVFGIDHMYVNSGEISNKGVELGLQLGLIDTRNFGFTVGGTLNKYKSRIESLGGPQERIIELGDGTTIITREGEVPYSFYGFATEGVFASQAEADAAGLTDYKGDRFNAGDIQFRDVNHDGVIDDKDRVILGNALPDMFGGLFGNIRYRSLSLSAHFNGSYGNQSYNAVRRSLESLSNFHNQSAAVTRRWQTNGQETDIPKAAYGDPMQNSRFSDRWIEDASFLRLTNLTLTYQIKSPVFNAIKGGNIYLTGENLLTFTDYLGLDPVHSYSNEPMMQGFDYGKTALPRTVKLGFNLQF